MISELASQNAPLQAVLFGLLLFVGIFSGIVLWTFRKGSNAKYDEASRLPLEQEDDIVTER